MGSVPTTPGPGGSGTQPGGPMYTAPGAPPPPPYSSPMQGYPSAPSPYGSGPAQGYPGAQAQGAMAMPIIVQKPTKWRALRTIAGILKVVAWIEAGIGALFALITLAGTASTSSSVASYSGAAAGGLAASGFIAALFILVGTALSFLWTYASGEAILVFLAIEENTRKA